MHMPSAAIGEADEHRDEIYPGHRWHAVMHTIVAAARVNDLRCVDGPYAGYSDEAGLARASRISLAMGFDGSSAFTPRSWPWSMRPSRHRGGHQRGRRGVQAYDAAVAAGQRRRTMAG